MNNSATERTAFVAIGGLSLCVCVLVDLFYFPPTTIFPDEQRFLTSAAQLVQTGSFAVNGSRAWEMPGTATLFAAFVALFSGPAHAVIPIRLFQASLLLFQAVQVGKLAQRLFDDRLTNIIAFSIAAFYPLLIYYQGLLLSETLFNTFLVAAMASLYKWSARKFRLDAAFLIALVYFALASYTKATLTFLPSLLMAAATLRAKDWRLTARTFLVSLLVYIVLLVPWWVRNYSLLNAFVPFTTSASSNLYLGNNPKNLTGGISWEADVDPTVVAQIYSMPGEVERQRAFGSEAARFIKERPGAFVDRMGLKFLRFWNVVPNAAEFNGRVYQLISLASFGPVLVLALVSIMLWWPRFAAFAPLLLLFAYFSILHMVTIASLRYRLPLEPFLIALAAAPIARVVRPLTSGSGVG